MLLPNFDQWQSIQSKCKSHFLKVTWCNMNSQSGFYIIKIVAVHWKKSPPSVISLWGQNRLLQWFRNIIFSNFQTYRVCRSLMFAHGLILRDSHTYVCIVLFKAILPHGLGLLMNEFPLGTDRVLSRYIVRFEGAAHDSAHRMISLSTYPEALLKTYKCGILSYWDCMETYGNCSGYEWLL